MRKIGRIDDVFWVSGRGDGVPGARVRKLNNLSEIGGLLTSLYKFVLIRRGPGSKSATGRKVILILGNDMPGVDHHVDLVAKVALSEGWVGREGADNYAESSKRAAYWNHAHLTVLGGGKKGGNGVGISNRPDKFGYAPMSDDNFRVVRELLVSSARAHQSTE